VCHSPPTGEMYCEVIVRSYRTGGSINAALAELQAEREAACPCNNRLLTAAELAWLAEQGTGDSGPDHACGAEGGAAGAQEGTHTEGRRGQGALSAGEGRAMRTILIFALLLVATPSFARGHSGGNHGHHSHASSRR
jgi:hypothetical protein